MVHTISSPLTFYRTDIERSAKPAPPVSITTEVSELLAMNAVVAIGVSGGKDSQACAIAVNRYLDSIGHTGARVLVHADLGRIEWTDSMIICEELADKLGLELMVVRRNAGDMLSRWQGRWANNVARYSELECVKVILPWSTPSMRFCTSELKVDVITSALKKRFPGKDIVNVAGIRREESAARRKMPVAAPQLKLKRKGNFGITWNAIIDWTLSDVFDLIEQSSLRLHEAYTNYGSSRVSCAFCIMSSEHDMKASAHCPDNHLIYRELVDLEAKSTFAFQGNRWLGDIAPHLLSVESKSALEVAKSRSIERKRIEDSIPKHLLFTNGVPTVMPRHDEAEQLARIRGKVAKLLELEIDYVSSSQILFKYEELMTELCLSN